MGISAIGFCRRYRNMGAYQRLFARFKLRLDPMFSELPSLLWKSDIRTVADIGCGYGVPACWMLERFADATVYGIDPDPGRVSVASRAVGKRGFIAVAGAPDIPVTPGPVDMATMLDMIHFLDDDQFRLTLIRLSVILGQKGRLIIRATLPPAYPFPWVWWMENLKNRAAGIQCHYRIFDEIETIVRQAGFDIELSTPSGSKGDLVWFILKVQKVTCLSMAEWTGLLSFLMAILLSFVDLRFSAVPLAGFVLLCLFAPFLPFLGYYLPVISRGKSGEQAVALNFR